MKKNSRKISIENSVIQKIQNDQVKMLPEWYFKTMSKGLKAASLVMVLSTSLLLFLVIYLIDSMSPRELLEFGDLGREVIIQDFPYIWFLSVLVLSIMSMLLYSKLDENYKKPRRKTWTTVLAAVIVLTLIMYALKIATDFDLGF